MAEDTQNEALIQEMLRDATKVNIPGELDKNPVLHKGDSMVPAPMVVKEISSAGYVYVWDTRSYEKIPILYYMLPSRLRQRRPDGSFRFTVTDPGILPKRGEYKCFLHADDPNRAHYNELGLQVCRKSNLTNRHQVTQHMLHKHPQEWKTIEEERKEVERKEDRDLQRTLLTRIADAGSKVEAKVETPRVEAKVEVPKTAYAFVCPNCSADFTNKSIYDKHVASCK